MAGNFSTLFIKNEVSSPDYAVVSSEKIHEIPHEINNAGIYLNHSILIGEILGVKVEESISILNIIHWAGEMFINDFPNRPFHGVPIQRDQTEELISEFDLVFAELSKAIDLEGRPLGTLGDLLKNNPRIGTDDYERLFVKSRHIYLVELQEILYSILELLKYGLNNNLQMLLV